MHDPHDYALLTLLSSTVKHAQLVKRQSKDNEITQSNVTQGLHIFCDQAVALYVLTVVNDDLHA
jgi:hypothetical protein